MLLSLLFCFIGFLLLYFSAEWLVKGSSSLARNMGVTPIVIGLTVVAFGTSAPELVVSLVSAVKGKSMIAVGNVIGSNICNIALVLGLSALFQPIKSTGEVVKRELPVMIGISLFLLLLSWNSVIGRIEGVILFSGVIAYTIVNYKIAMRKNASNAGAGAPSYRADLDNVEHVASRGKQVILIILGIAGVALGAKIVVDSAVKIMTALGVDEKFISLTLVAFGTSLPELTTSVVAAMRKEMDISIGNLLGSNVFNILSVLGAASIVRPIYIQGGFIESGLIIDYFVMMVISILPWIMMRKSFTINRMNGATLLLCYAGYITFLIMKT